MTSIRSKTSEAIDETLLVDYKMDSSQVQPKRARIRHASGTTGKNYVNDDQSGENSASVDNMYSVDESSNAGIKNRNKKKKIGKSSKGVRRP